MKRICIIMPFALPVPAVLGGAIEQLVTWLVEGNEKYHLAELTVITIYNDAAYELSKHFGNTRFIFIHKPNLFLFTKYRMARFVSFLLKARDFNEGLYYKRCLSAVCGEDFDAIVAEGGRYPSFYEFTKIFGREKMFLHIHHHLKADALLERTFGNIIATSNFIEREWVDTCQTDCNHEVVYNAVDESTFGVKFSDGVRERLRIKLGIQEDDFVVIFVGRFFKIKGLLELIKAVQIVNQHREKKIKLLAVGSVDFSSNMKDSYHRAVSNEANGETVFTGYVTNEDLPKYYSIADLQVIPSICEEAAGLVAIEGMLSGLPLVVTDSGGLVEYVNGECAVIVEKGNALYDEAERIKFIDRLAGVLQSVVDDPAMLERMRAAAKIRAKKFCKKQYYRDYIDCINKFTTLNE